MTDVASHLGDHARAALELPTEERVARIRSPRWIGYTRAKQILRQLDELLDHPKTHRMPNLLLVGDTNNGKTVIAKRFEKLHPAEETMGGEAVVVPVLVVQAPPVPDEARLYTAILDELFAPHRPTQRAAQKQCEVLHLLRYVRLKVLVIDEIHHVLAGHEAKQRQFLNVLKYLGNELQVPIVGVGIREAVRAIQTDPQLANRFEPVALPRWEMGQDYLMLLASFERMLPLRQPSRLVQPKLATRLLALSEGTIGELVALLTTAAVYAVRTGAELIDERSLVSIDWTPPSERKRRIEQLR